MSTVRDHYERFLAAHYTWMSGGHAAQVPRNRELLAELGFAARPGERALDLGCGSGYQALALARQGYDVYAVDTSRQLLDELRTRSAGQRITPIQGDMFDSETYGTHAPFEAVVCMGDSLTLAASWDQVAATLGEIHAHLHPGGRVLLSFRELASEPVGSDRALPVRLDEDRLMVTFLEYLEARVRVNDVLLVRDPGAGWRLIQSAYEKLRLSASEVLSLLREAGFTNEARSTDRGFTIIAADRS